MDFDAIASVYLVPLAEPIAAPAVPLSAARRLRDAVEPIATQGWWCRSVNERMQALGLDFFQGYVWGRAAALGEPNASVVAAAFGVFEPGFIGAVYDSARPVATRSAVLAARDAGAADGMSVLDGEPLDSVAEPLLAAMDGLDPTARPLFAGLRSLPVPDNAGGRLWRAAELVREHRGDGHLAACVAAGLDLVEMNVLTELWLDFPLGTYSGTRGFGPDRIDAAVASLTARGWLRDGAVTPSGLAARLAIEQATDDSQAALVAALGADLDRIVALTDGWSARLVAAGQFPSDPRKRAAG
jgi:hypothetical protein